MSRKSEGLLASLLDERWSATHAPVPNSANANVSIAAPQSANSRHNLETVSYSFKNLTGANATVVTSVRDSTITGTVRASWEDIVAAGVTGGKVLDNLGIQGLKGDSLWITQDTKQASVTGIVNASGWTDTTNA